jgi:hypothetical protein
MENDGKDKQKLKAANGAGLQTDGRFSRARSAVSSGASRVASTVSNNKKSLGLGAAAAAVAAAGVMAVVKRRKTALKTTTPEAPAETSLLADPTPAETSGLRGV